MLPGITREDWPALRPRKYWGTFTSISSQQVLGRIGKHFVPGITRENLPAFPPRKYQGKLTSISSQEHCEKIASISSRTYWGNLASISAQDLLRKMCQHFGPIIFGKQAFHFVASQWEKMASISSQVPLGKTGQQIVPT